MQNRYDNGLGSGRALYTAMLLVSEIFTEAQFGVAAGVRACVRVCVRTCV
jgi:hypothetical protein